MVTTGANRIHFGRLILVLVLLASAVAVWIITDNGIDVKGNTRSPDTAVQGLRMGMRTADVVKAMGKPDVVLSSLAEMEDEPYPLSWLPKGEKVMLYHDYPWGVFVYIDQKQGRVSRLVLVRHV